jgi:hypothetical protein
MLAQQQSRNRWLAIIAVLLAVLVVAGLIGR